MPFHNGIISFLLAADKAEAFSQEVTLKSGHMGRVTTLEELAHYLGLRGSGTGIRGSQAKIAAHHQERFANLYGFADDPDCLDALEREDEDTFRRAFAEWRERQKEAARAKSSAHAITMSRQYDPAAQLRLERLVRVEPHDVDAVTLASITLFLQQVGPGESLPVSVEIVCQPTPLEGFVIAVRRGRLLLDLGGGEIARDQPVFATSGVETQACGNHSVSLERANSPGGDTVAWIVQNIDGPIGILRFNEDTHLLRIAKPVEGEEVVATFQVFVKDLVLAEQDIDDDNDRADPYSFLRPDGKPLSAAKRQIIKRLLLKEVLDAAGKAWLTVAEDRRRLVRDGK